MDKDTFANAQELKDKYSQITKGFSLEEIDEIYRNYSTDWFAAGWMHPTDHDVEKAFSISPLARKKKLIWGLEKCKSKEEADKLLWEFIDDKDIEVAYKSVEQ